MAMSDRGGSPNRYCGTLAGWPAANTRSLGDQLVERLGVTDGTGSVPMGRSGGRHGDGMGVRTEKWWRRAALFFNGWPAAS